MAHLEFEEKWLQSALSKMAHLLAFLGSVRMKLFKEGGIMNVRDIELIPEEHEKFSMITINALRFHI